MKTTLCIFALLTAFALGYWLGTRSVEVVESLRIDTVFYEKPRPINTSREVVSVTIPKLLFAPTDTLTQTVVVSVGDSVHLQLAIEHREYRDSTYHARISGPAVGDYGPTLDWIETYDRTRTLTVTKRHRFAVTAGVGGAYTPRGFQPYVGVGVGVILWKF